jgi:ubiquinone biosynthesis protein UbiJ
MEVEVKNLGELSILGLLVKGWIEENLKDERKLESIRNLECRAVIKAGEMAINLHFSGGKVSMANEEVKNPDALIEGKISELIKLRERPLLAIITRKVKMKGLLTLIKIRKVIIPEYRDGSG